MSGPVAVRAHTRGRPRRGIGSAEAWPVPYSPIAHFRGLWRAGAQLEAAVEHLPANEQAARLQAVADDVTRDEVVREAARSRAGLARDRALRGQEAAADAAGDDDTMEDV